MPAGKSTVRFDDATQDMARALCAEYHCTMNHLLRRLVHLQYNGLLARKVRRPPAQEEPQPRPGEKQPQP